MFRKSLMLASCLLLAIGLVSFGGVAVFAWNATLPSNLCTVAPCTTTGTVSPGSCTSPCSFALGQKVYDSVTIYDPNTGGAYDGCSSTGFGSGTMPCAITGTVSFSLYSVPSGFTCSGSPPGTPSGTGVSQVGSTQTYTFPTTGTLQYPPVVVSTPTAYSPPSAGHYVSYISYTGNYKNGGSTAACEYFTVTPSTGVPEFGSGALGMLLVFAMAVPLLVAARKFRSPIRMP